MIIFRSDMIFYVLAAYVFVAGCNTRSQTASPREAAYTVTLRELDREISDPPTIAGEFKDSAFIKAYYVPHLRTAKASLSDLLIGKRDEKLVAALVRPAGKESIILWFMWLQIDNSPRTVGLFKGDVRIANFSVPTPDSPYVSLTTFIRVEVFQFKMEGTSVSRAGTSQPTSKDVERLLHSNDITLALYAHDILKDRIDVATLSQADPTRWR